MKPRILNTARLSFPLAAAIATLLAAPVAQAVTYTWDPTNVTGTPTPTLDWFTGGANPLGVWTGVVVPISASDTTIQFFPNTTTSLPNTVPATQIVNLNNGGSAFQLGTLTLNGFGSATSGASLTMTLQGDDLNFSAATGTINFSSVKNVAPASDTVINYNINNAIQLGTASSASALTLTGNGDNAGTTTYNIVGAISELQIGGGSILKSGTSLVAISGAVNITGAVTVSAGRLTLSSNTNTASSMTVNNGGTLFLTGNLNPASGSMTVNSGGILQIGDNTATQFGPLGVYSGNISTGTGGTLLLRSSSTQELSGMISGSGGINKGRSGTLTLSGANTYTGKSVFQPLANGQSFQVNVSSFNSVVGGTASSSLGAPTTVANGTIDIGGVAQAGVTLNYTGGGETTDRVVAVAWNGNSTQTIQASGGGLLKFTSPFTAASSGGTGSLVLTGAGNGEVNGIRGSINSTGLSKTGNGTWTISGPSTFTQPTTITGGVLNLSHSLALQNSPFSTASSAGTGSLGLRTSVTTLTLGGLTGSNALKGRFTTATGGPSNTTTTGGYDGLTALTLNTVAGASHTFTGAIVNGATGLTLTKTGFGTQFLNNANTYTGLTTISQGTLAGNGSFAGAVSLDSNTSVALSPGATAGAVGTLTISDASASALTLNGNLLNFDVVGAGTSDKIAITGDLVLNGTNTVLLNLPAAGIAASTNIDLMTYANKTGSGSLVFANGLTTMGSLTLVANATTNAQLQVGAGGLNHSVWSGATGAWDGGATNWTRNGVATQAYVDGDFVTFNDSGTTLTVTSAGTVSPASVTVNNSTKAYIINATIGGADTPLIKSGTNSLTLGGTNTFGGGLFLNGGTVNVNGTTDSLGAAGSTITVLSDSTLNQGGSGAISLNKNLAVNGGTLTFVHGNNSWTIQGIVSGSNTIKVNDAGSINQRPLGLINTANTFTGAIDLLNNNSTITVASLGDTVGSGNIIFGAANSAFQLGTTAVAPLALSNRVFEFRGGTSTGQINNNNATSSNTLTINTNLSVTTAGTKTLQLAGTNTGANTFAGIISNGTGTVALTKTDVGTWEISGNNSYTGTTGVSVGTLIMSGNNTTSGTITVSGASGATLTLSGNNSGMSSNVTLSTSFPTTAGSSPLLNINSATALGTGILNFGGGAATDTVRINNTSAGTVNVSTANPITMNRDFTFVGTRDLNLGTGAITLGGMVASTNRIITVTANTLTLAGAIADGVNGLSGITKAGVNGTLVLSGTNTYTHLTTVSAGTLIAGNNSPSGSAGAFGNASSEISLGAASSNNNASILTNGAFNVGRVVRLATANTTDAGLRVLTLGGNTAHNSEFSGNIFLGTASQAGRGVTLTAASGGQVTFSGVIQNPGSMDATTYTVTKSGLGTVVLSNTNTYTDATTVSAGALLVNGSLDASSNVTVQTTGTLGGTGTINGSVTVASDGNIAPGASAGTLSIGGNLNISAQANGGTGKLNFELGPIANSDKIALTGSGSLTIGGAFLDFSDFDFDAIAGLQNGTYKLITSPNAISGGLDTTPANLTGAVGGGTGTLQITGNDVELLVSGIGAGSAYDTWKAVNAPSGNPDDDFDGDGVSNAVEFVLGGLASTNDLSKLPTLTTPGGDMIFNFKRAQSSIDPKTAVFIEVGTDLAIWNTPSSPYTVPDLATAGPPLAVVKNSPSAGTDNVTLTLAQAPDAQKFARLKVVITP